MMVLHKAPSQTGEPRMAERHLTRPSCVESGSSRQRRIRLEYLVVPTGVDRNDRLEAFQLRPSCG